tara:strand:+ start:24216 stop:24812 length:597 start_codon:yes stop_codon:yes gene_type:complete
MSSEIKANTISEVTSANGVSIDGVKLKDNSVIIGDGGNIGSASDLDAISISSAGYVIDSARPHFVVDGNQGQSTAVGNGSRVPFNDEVRNHGGNFDTSNYFFLTPVAGVYLFHVQLYTYHSGTQRYDFRIYSHDTSDSNGVVLSRAQQSWDGGKLITMSALSYLTANRRISIYNETGDSRDLYMDNLNHSFFTGCLIG